MKVLVNIEGFRTTESGAAKIWTTDGVPTYACSMEACYYIREKATKYNNYQPYEGYVPVSKCVEVTK